MRFEIESSNDILTTHSGLGLVGLLYEKTDLFHKLNGKALPGLNRIPTISNDAIVRAYLGLLTQGKNDFDHIEPFRKDHFFRHALHLKKVPSAPRLRQRLDLAGEANAWSSDILDAAALLPQRAGLEPSAIQLSSGDYVPVDLDVSPFDNHNTKKEGVARTYKGCDGYAPLFAYIGREGYGLHAELRNGDVHCQKHTPESLETVLDRAQTMTDRSLLLRMDAGNDSRDNLAICQERGVSFVVKRNLRQEPKEGWRVFAQQHAEPEVLREGKERYRGMIAVDGVDSLDQPVHIVFDVTVKTMERDGQILLIPEVEADTYWTNLTDEADVIIDLYHDHATCEQFHSELKTDLDLERLPSGKFATNHLILCLGILAYNILRIIGQESLKIDDTPLKRKVHRRRVRTTIQTLITLAAKLVHHARRWSLRMGDNPWMPVFKRLYLTFS
ncbi:MAG TPA: IS1380 family transposase [Solirubrobacterales bacterium]|nr:IS1380 family transposase [Solirubrobacterales bacterium]